MNELYNVIMNVRIEAMTTAILAIFALIVLAIVAFLIFVKDKPHFSAAKLMIFGCAALMLFAGIFL